jgi:hypothetical protein
MDNCDTLKFDRLLQTLLDEIRNFGHFQQIPVAFTPDSGLSARENTRPPPTSCPVNAKLGCNFSAVEYVKHSTADK